MSVEEIIEQIRALPQDEYQKVVRFLNETLRAEDAHAAADAASEVRPGFSEVARQVFDRHDDLFRKLGQ